MQGKPPPGQGPKASPSSPGGMGPQIAQGPQMAPLPPVAPGALQGLPPPAGADAKRRGRGGAGVQLSDVGWGKIFKLGWKLLSFFKFLALAYCLMMLVQNCVNLGMSQLIGEVTKALNATSRASEETAVPASVPSPAPANRNAVTPTSPSNTAPAPEAPPKSRLLLVSVLWAIFALAALAM